MYPIEVHQKSKSRMSYQASLLDTRFLATAYVISAIVNMKETWMTRWR